MLDNEGERLKGGGCLMGGHTSVVGAGGGGVSYGLRLPIIGCIPL